jgi:diadenosine tetraphosphate (Ap4A) HIT family hydrolase
VLKQLTGCDKLNVAAIGNVVPQLHVHVVARAAHTVCKGFKVGFVCR